MRIEPPGISERRIVEQASERSVCKNMRKRQRRHTRYIKAPVYICAADHVKAPLCLQNGGGIRMQNWRRLPFRRCQRLRLTCDMACRSAQKKNRGRIEPFRQEHMHAIRRLNRRRPQHTQVKVKPIHAHQGPQARIGGKTRAVRVCVPIEQDNRAVARNSHRP